jgi:hypothetical protein
MDRSIVELMRFEFERFWTAKYLGFMILLLILFINIPATILPGAISTSDLMSFTGGFRSLLVYLFVTIALTNSFCNDVKQSVMMDEFTNPVRKSAIFISKLLVSFLIIILMNLLLIAFSSWLASGSLLLSSILLVTLVQTIVSMLFAALAIFMGIVVQSTIASILTPLSIYFLEGYFMLFLGLNYSVEGVILHLVSAGLDGMVALFAAIIHVSLPIALLVFSFLFFTEVLELD